jgi:ubiquinone/menaquinone biosynthesis C-methylase UbiE
MIIAFAEIAMPEAPLTREEAGVPDIDALYRPTHDEYARQRFVAVMRNHAFNDLRDSLCDTYEREVAPQLQKRGVPLPDDGHGIEKVMQTHPLYRFYSTLRYNAQEMMYLSVQEPVERVAADMIAVGRAAAANRPAGGSLRLDPELAVPRYVTAQDIHLAPGCFHSEYTADDLTQGAVLAHGGRVGTGAMAHRRDAGAVAQSVGNWLTLRYPAFKPRRILDIGTQSGKNLIPYRDAYPDAELFGIDVSAPTLRYGHAKAEHEGVPVHFSQQNAESTDFADGSFDLIVSSFFFHEVPVPVTRRILKECYRLLSPGGMMAHMELPPHKLATPVLNFMWDWDTKNNNEPSYTAFRSQDPVALCVEAGFRAEDVIETTVPNRESFTREQHRQFLNGERSVPRHGRGGWFVFGARKVP